MNHKRGRSFRVVLALTAYAGMVAPACAVGGPLPWQASPWELHRWEILGLLVVLAIQSALIVLLTRINAKRKRAEKQLKKSEEKFSKAFRENPSGFTLTSLRDYRYLEVNEAFERATGWRREEVLGRTPFDFKLWDDPEQRKNLAKRLLAGERLRNVEFQFRHRTGELRIALGSAEIIEIENEPCMLSVIIDITDRKRAEAALRESEERFRLVANTAPVMIWMSGEDKLCTYVNQPWLNFTGRALDAELGDGWTQVVHPDDLASCLENYGKMFDRRLEFDQHYRMRRHDGEYRWVHNHGVPRINASNGFEGYIGCCIDVTQEIEAKATLAEFSGKLIQAQEEERSRIARELHDDISQRLALLSNLLQELGQRGRDAQTAQTRDLLKLTNEIAADIQHMSHQLHPSKLRYLGLAGAARNLCQEFSRQYKIEVECIAQELPRDLDDAIALNLFRTIQESLRNIGKHSRARHAKVQLVCASGVVHLHVSDDGVGFDSEQLEHEGLGLVSMQERLRSVGGEFRVRSNPSRGTHVDVTVPLKTKIAHEPPGDAILSPSAAPRQF